MKRTKRARLLCGLLCLLLLSGCAVTPQTESAGALASAAEAEALEAYLYDTDKTMEFAPEADFCTLLSGEWTPAASKGKGAKVLSLILDTQYEICFFDDGGAMIYYGYAGILERDRQYYTFSPSENVEKMAEYIKEHGVFTEPADAVGTAANAQKLQAHLPDGDLFAEFAPEANFCTLLSGNWTPAAESSAEKVLSLMIGAHYEICFLADGKAMFCYNCRGFSGDDSALDLDWKYFTFSPSENLEKMIEYIKENGARIDEDAALFPKD